MTIDTNIAVYVLFVLQVVAFLGVAAAGIKIARGPVKRTVGSVKSLTQRGGHLGEIGKGLVALVPKAKAIGAGAQSVRAAAGLAPPPAGMLLTPQRLVQSVGLVRTARAALKARKLPKKKPSLALKAATKLGLVPPAAGAILKGVGIAKTGIRVARSVRRGR
jgi:hypothetical protein